MKNSHPKNSLLETFRNILIYILPLILFLSYYPLIIVGVERTMNLELSLPLIWLVLFDGVCFIEMCTKIKNGWRHEYRGISDRKIFLFSLLPFYATISIFWSANALRATLTAGIIWLLFFAIFIITNFLPLFDIKNLAKIFIKSLFISTIIVCIWCWTQCILDLIGIGTETTLLCAGCTYKTFGFPHPNGFAIEPQFMGNLLLAPSLLSFYYLLKQKQPFKFVLISSFIIATLFLTFSRGAIFSFVIGILAISIAELSKKQKIKSLLKPLLVVAAAFLFTLTAQGIFAQASKTNDTFFTGIEKSINQLSLGKIKIETQNNVQTSSPSVAPEETQSSTFDGYVEESTNRRLLLSSYALAAWTSSPFNFFFGTGLGSTGIVFDQMFGTGVIEIAQNEPLEIALELGLIGLALSIFILANIFFAIKKSPHFSFYLSLFLAFGFAFLFFSGLSNALHVFLLPAFFYVFKDNLVINQKAH